MCELSIDFGQKSTTKQYKDFQERFKLLATKHPKLIINTLSNIFTMRLIGNKTHGDLAEIGIAEFIHQFMYDFDSRHVGKDLFRAKEHEEDILIINELTREEIESVTFLDSTSTSPLSHAKTISWSIFIRVKACSTAPIPLNTVANLIIRTPIN